MNGTVLRSAHRSFEGVAQRLLHRAPGDRVLESGAWRARGEPLSWLTKKIHGANVKRMQKGRVDYVVVLRKWAECFRKF